MRDGGPRAVIFDMDGLMLDTERIALRAWQRATALYGCAPREDVYLSTVGLNAADSEALLTGALGPSVPLQEISALQERLFTEEVALHGIVPKPGLFELLAALEAWGIPAAVATSTARARAVEILTRTDLATRFRAVVGGDQVARGKPAPDILLRAADQLGVPPGRCIVLEDSTPGILAACAAGMTPILIPDLLPPPAEIAVLAYRVVPSLTEATAVLAALRGGAA